MKNLFGERSKFRKNVSPTLIFFLGVDFEVGVLQIGSVKSIRHEEEELIQYFVGVKVQIFR